MLVQDCLRLSDPAPLCSAGISQATYDVLDATRPFRSLVGARGIAKIVEDSVERLVTNDPFVMMEALLLDRPAPSLLLEIARGHSRQHGHDGVVTLVVLSSLLLEAAASLSAQAGCSAVQLVRPLEAALGVCLDACDAIAVELTPPVPSPTQHSEPADDDDDDVSWFFDEPVAPPQAPAPTLAHSDSFETLAAPLIHYEPEHAQLTLSALKMAEYEASRVHLRSVPGVQGACVVLGVAVPLCVAQLEAVRQWLGSSLQASAKVWLVDADSGATSVVRLPGDCLGLVLSTSAGSSSGTNSGLVLWSIEPSDIDAAAAAAAKPVLQGWELVGSGMTGSQCSVQLVAGDESSWTGIVLVPEAQVGKSSSLVLSGSTATTRRLRQFTLQRCIHRLGAAKLCNKALPGAGQTERACIQALANAQAGVQVDSVLWLSFGVMVRSFERWLQLLESNVEQCELEGFHPQANLLDSFDAKKAALASAVHFVASMLQMA